jgi:hypothetical protein
MGLPLRQFEVPFPRRQPEIPDPAAVPRRWGRAAAGGARRHRRTTSAKIGTETDLAHPKESVVAVAAVPKSHRTLRQYEQEAGIGTAESAVAPEVAAMFDEAGEGGGGVAAEEVRVAWSRRMVRSRREVTPVGFHP